MEIRKFEAFIEETRADFKSLISEYLDSVTGEMKTLIKRAVSKCESDFELNTLKENLQEEFEQYLESFDTGE